MGEEYKEVLSAVERGEESAKTRLAWYKLSGMGGAKVGVDGAVNLLEERVKEKDGEAMWMLGLCKDSAENGMKHGMYYLFSEWYDLDVFFFIVSSLRQKEHKDNLHDLQ